MEAPRSSASASPANPCGTSGPARVASLVVAGATAALIDSSKVAFYLRRVAPPLGKHQSLVRTATALAERHQLADKGGAIGQDRDTDRNSQVIAHASWSQAGRLRAGTTENKTQEGSIKNSR
jgi:hypothetical protein